MRLIKNLVAGIAFLSVATGAIAQTTTGGASYLLQPEDVLRIQVFGQPQIQADVPVAVDGTVSVPFVGSVMAKGRTVDSLIAELATLFEKKLRLREPIVSVSLVSFRRLRATVGGGGVNRPGTVEFRQGDTILVLLNQGGGVIRDVADLRRSYLRRGKSRELIPIDLQALTVYGDTSQNYELQDGDELTIPDNPRNQVVITGTVQRPGPFPYREPMTLSDALALAGGEVRYRSRLSKIEIFRQRQGLPGEYLTIKADYVRFVRNHDQTQNVLLQAGDFIWVPETNTPDVSQISSLANVAYIIDRFGGSLFGFKIFQ